MGSRKREAIFMGIGVLAGFALSSPAAQAATTITATFSNQPIYVDGQRMSMIAYNNGSLGTLKIPAIGLTVKVVQGTSSAALSKGAGHFPDTSIWDGNVALAGHNGGVNNHFGKIHTLEAGDTITPTTQLGTRNRTLAQFKELHQDNVRGINSLTEDEYKYATQLAVWATCGQLAVPGTSFSAGRATLTAPTSDAQKIRVFDSVKAILNLANGWTKNLYTGMYLRAEENRDVRGVEVIHERGLAGAAENNADGIKKETINPCQ